MRTTALVVLVGATACQTYDFERVTPLAVSVDNETRLLTRRGLKPNVMLLVDNSGSMNDPADESLAACTNGSGLCGSTSYACPAACPTRVQEMKRAMSSLLTNSGAVARVGLTVYPETQCQAPRAIDRQLPAPSTDDEGLDPALQAHARDIDERLQRLSPGGGTPTGGALEFLRDYRGLNEDDGRDDFVLLLTDGLPNCSDANVNNVCGCYAGGCSSEAVAACRCTTASCLNVAQCSQGCLDLGGAVSAVEALRERGVQTIVVGFGADLATGDAAQVLNAMANAGGFARDCGGQACDTAFYRAQTGDELASALTAIWDRFPRGLCVWTLDDPPSDARFISVLLNGTDVPGGADTWTFDANTREVTLHGETCATVERSTVQRPVSLEIRSARKL